MLKAPRLGPMGMVVLHHKDSGGYVRRRTGFASAAPLGTMAAGPRVLRTTYLPIGTGDVEVLHIGVSKGPNLMPLMQ